MNVYFWSVNVFFNVRGCKKSRGERESESKTDEKDPELDRELKEVRRQKLN